MTSLKVRENAVRRRCDRHGWELWKASANRARNRPASYLLLRRGTRNQATKVIFGPVHDLAAVEAELDDWSERQAAFDKRQAERDARQSDTDEATIRRQTLELFRKKGAGDV
jgi:hypothetical protein